MVVKRECDTAAEQQPAAEEQPAAKARRTGAHCEDKRHIEWAATIFSDCQTRQQDSQAWAQTVTPNATTAPQAAAELPKAAAEVPVEPKATAAKLPKAASTFAHRQENTLKHAELHMRYWWNVVQREKMQLQAHLDGNRRVEEFQLEEVKNNWGVVIAHIDPDPDIDRLHIKVYICFPDPDSEKYICFLDSKFADTIAKLKKKIQEHPDVVHMTFKDMKVFYNGCELADTDTIDDLNIDDDCILHAVDNVYGAPTWVAKSSAQLNQWRLLLPKSNPWRTQSKTCPSFIERGLNPRPLSSVVSGASPAAIG
jgi:hypothetical protein